MSGLEILALIWMLSAAAFCWAVLNAEPRDGLRDAPDVGATSAAEPSPVHVVPALEPVPEPVLLRAVS